MKTILRYLCLSVACIGFSITSNAQDLIESFKNQPNVETVAVNKKMFQMMSNVKMDMNDKENQAYLNLIKKLDDLKLISTKNTTSSGKMKTYVVSYVKTNSMNELMTLSENGSTTIFYVDPNSTKESIKELLMFVSGNETIILSLKGSFSLNELSLVTNKMKLPVGNSLNKMSK